MSITKIARKDFRDAVQSRALWALVAVFVILSLISSFAYVELPEMFGEPEGATFEGLLMFTVGLLSLFVPLAAIVACYKSLAGERESGSIKLLLSQPTTRSWVFYGKVLGRSAVLLTGLGIGLVIGIVFGAIYLGEFAVLPLVALLVLTAAFIIVYASIMVGISATTGSTTKATTFTLGFFVIAELLWDVIPIGIVYVVEGFSLPQEIPNWATGLMQLSPSMGFFSGMVALVPELERLSNGESPGVGVGVSPGEEQSLFLMPEIGLLVLVFWFVLALVIGRTRFNRADI